MSPCCVLQCSSLAYKNAGADDASLVENHSSLNLPLYRSILLTSDTHLRLPHVIFSLQSYRLCVCFLVFNLSATTVSVGDCYSPPLFRAMHINKIIFRFLCYVTPLVALCGRRRCQGELCLGLCVVC